MAYCSCSCHVPLQVVLRSLSCPNGKEWLCTCHNRCFAILSLPSYVDLMHVSVHAAVLFNLLSVCCMSFASSTGSLTRTDSSVRMCHIWRPGRKESSLSKSDAGFSDIQAVCSGIAEDSPVQGFYPESLKSSCTSIRITAFMCCAQGTQLLYNK